MLTALLLALSLQPGKLITKEVAPGLTYTYESLTEPPTVLHCLRFSPSKVQMRVALAQDEIGLEKPLKGRETVGSIARRAHATAAVNGDFFPFSGDPLGLCIVDGQIVSEPLNRRAAIGWRRDGTIMFGNPTFSAAALGPAAQQIKIGGLNRECGAGEAVLWLSSGSTRATSSKPATAVTLRGLNLPMRNGAPLDAIVAEVLQNATSVPIPADGCVLFVRDPVGEETARQSARGALWTFILTLTDSAPWDQAVWALGGGPWLVRNGQKFIDTAEEKFEPTFATKRHPRTAVGRTAGGDALLMVVEGRSEESGGMSLAELSETMIRYGAVEAINLDGGGSTDIALQGLSVMNPSDGKPRPVANALLLFAQADAEPTGIHALQPKFSTMKVGATFDWGLRELKSGQPIQHTEVVWACTPGVGRIDQFGSFVALKPGMAVVSAYCHGTTTRAIVLVQP